MTLRISRALLAAIVARGRGVSTETCGLLLGAGDAVDEARACANVHATPTTRFEIDPAALLAAHRAARAGGMAIVGCYHSHPHGGSMPSPRDAADAAPDGRIWLIVGADGTARAWRAVRDGTVHGRFDPVRIDHGPPCAGVAASP